MELSPHTYGFESMRSLLSEALTEKMEIVSAKFGPMIRIKPNAEKDVSAEPHLTRSVSRQIVPGFFNLQPVYRIYSNCSKSLILY